MGLQRGISAGLTLAVGHSQGHVLRELEKTATQVLNQEKAHTTVLLQ